MPPQQTVFTPGQAPTPANNGQFDFIVNANHGGGSSFFSANAPLKTRILIVAGGAAVLLTLALVLVAVISRAGSINSADLVNVAQRQAELARISQTPVTSADAQLTRNFAATTMLSLVSEQQTIIHFLAQNGTAVSTQVLQARKDAQTDTALKDAQTNGSYDQTYLSITKTQLQAYSQALKQAFQSASTIDEKFMLQDAYSQAQLLLAQSSQTE